MSLNYKLLFSPLEQFDAVTWIPYNWVLESNVYGKQYILKGLYPTEIWSIKSDNINILLLILSFYFFLGFVNILVQNKSTIEIFINKVKGDLSIVFFLIFFYFITGGFFSFWFADWAQKSFIDTDDHYSSYHLIKHHYWNGMWWRHTSSWETRTPGPFGTEIITRGPYVHKGALFGNWAEKYSNIVEMRDQLVNLYWVPTKTIIIPQLNVALLLDENLISFLAAFLLFNGAEDSEDENFLLEEEESDFIGDVVAPLFIANLGKNVEDNGALYLKVSGIFGFIFINNIMGMLPYSDTGTSSLLLTFWVALSVFVSLLTLMLTKHGVNYLFNLFLPEGTPIAIIFLLIPIEFISYTFRLLSLSVRLFANMMAGHTLLKVIVGFSWSMILMGDFFLIANLFPVGILFLLTFLEIGVALIQTYVFTILTCMYLRDIFVGH